MDDKNDFLRNTDAIQETIKKLSMLFEAIAADSGAVGLVRVTHTNQIRCNAATT
jgi:hypothetical protein